MPTLLVVDDEPSILHAFRRAFQDEPLTLVTTTSAIEAIDLVREQEPDVVILDVELPGMSGLDVFRQIRQQNARLPVIFITGRGTAETAIEATKLGALDYLFKPLELDEIGDLTPLAQAKILRFLQEREFERVGGNETLKADVRVIAATNTDLEQSVATGGFRKDLYYRLSVITIELPPLRERGDDLRLLADHYVRRFASELGKEVREVSPATYKLLDRYPWPGNIRELQSVLKQAILCAAGPVLAPEFLPSIVQDDPKCPTPRPIGESEWDLFVHRRLREGTDSLYAEWNEMTDRVLLTHVLDHTGGNISQAARILGINRPTLRAKLHDLGMYDP